MIMVNEFLKRLKPDFSNIDNVYNELLEQYAPDNINTSELMFIDNIDFSNAENTQNTHRLSNYLGQKRNTIEWQNIDYYNDYLKTKHFRFLLHTYISPENAYNKPPYSKVIEYNDFLNTINDLETRYKYIFRKLKGIDRKELKFDFLDLLEKFEKKQVYRLFQFNISKLRLVVESYYKRKK